MPFRSVRVLTAVSPIVLALLAPASGRAHDNGLYVSIKLGTTDVDASLGDAFDQVVEGDDDSQAVEVGYRWSPHFAIQGAYHDFGEVPGFGVPCREDDEVCIPIEVPIESETKAYSLAFVPQFPLGKRLSVFGKVGAVALESEVRDAEGTAADFFEDFSEEDVIWGAGLRLRIIGPIQIFYEYEGIGDDFESQYFGATWQF
jgi:hypothetical protein